jgi:hypothetical protein
MDNRLAYIFLAMLVAFVCATWIGARRFGIAGLVCVHVLVLFCFFAFAAYSSSIGVYEYDGSLSAAGLAIQAFLLNCLLLPAGVSGILKRNRTDRGEPSAAPETGRRRRRGNP